VEAACCWIGLPPLAGRLPDGRVRVSSSLRARVVVVGAYMLGWWVVRRVSCRVDEMKSGRTATRRRTNDDDGSNRCGTACAATPGRGRARASRAALRARMALPASPRHGDTLVNSSFS